MTATTDQYTSGSGLARATTLVLTALLLFGIGVESAVAVPGEIVGKAVTFANVNGSDPIQDGGRPLTAIRGGGYLALADAKRTKLAKGLRYVLDQRKLKVRRYSSSGRLIESFARTEIGRGMSLGKKGEVFEFRGTLHYSGTTYVTWATSVPGAYTGSGHSKFKAELVAFDGRTGKLVKTFGTNGRLIYSGSDAHDLKVLSDGRMVLCGEAFGFPALPRIPDRTGPFVVTARMDSKAFTPFLTNGSATVAFRPDDTTTSWKACGRITETSSGEVNLIGLESDRVTGSNSRIWVQRYLPSGSADPSFGSGGEVVVTPESTGISTTDLTPLVVLSGESRSLYIAGKGPSKGIRGFVMSLRADGSMDTSFGTAGLKIISEFSVDDMRARVSGGVELTGHTPGERPAAGWLGSTGAWDPNFMGRGFHIYSDAFAYPWNIVKSSTSRTTAWGWIPKARTARKCGCFPITLASFETAVQLDSSIVEVKPARRGRINAKGFASSFTGLSEVQLGIGYGGKPPVDWVRASGTHRWNATLSVAAGTHKTSTLYSRAIATGLEVEASFSSKDGNKRRVLPES